MAAGGKQVKNGKAFEYALANQYAAYLKGMGLAVNVLEDRVYANTKKCYDQQSTDAQTAFDEAARQTINTIISLEPGLTAQKDADDALEVMLIPDSNGEDGDVRDVVFRRVSARWEIGFSAKNNNESAKHSRLSMEADFGRKWFGVPCPQKYFDEIRPVFKMLDSNIAAKARWRDIPNKRGRVYVPVLSAFRDALLSINASVENIPRKLLKYVIGMNPFYQVKKDDSHNLVVVRAFNVDGLLNKKINGVKARYSTPKLVPPTRIVEFDFQPKSETTLIMFMDGGWELSFRIHNADGPVVNSLKFDIKLIGNPPVLFSQHLFQN